jgi:DNA-binding NtrC family response regulator
VNKRVLIVDDDASMLSYVALIADSYGICEIDVASSGDEALAKMALQQFDLLITDLRMPGMNGLDLMEQVGARCPHTRLIMMTAHSDAKTTKRAFELGAYEVLAKPFSKQRLLIAIVGALA